MWMYEEDISNSREITLIDLDALGLTARFRDSFMRLPSYFV